MEKALSSLGEGSHCQGLRDYGYGDGNGNGYS